MRTLIYQVWGGPRPAWISRCMGTVETWAAIRGYDYRVIPLAEFVREAPKWLTDKCGESLIHPILDYMRVLQAQGYLKDGWERAVWFDADVLVTRPDLLRIPTNRAAFMAETWSLWPEGEEVHKHRVTNCICSFVRGDSFTDRYLRFMEATGNTTTPMSKAALGTDLLTSLPASAKPDIISNVGNLSPHALAAIVAREDERVRVFLEETGESLYAVNVCASHEDADYLGVKNSQHDYAVAVERLLQDLGLLELSEAR